MKTALWVVVLGLAGAFCGYMVGVYLACSVLWPESNLCGLVGVFITAPLGLVAGIIGGVVIARRSSDAPPP